MPQSKMFQAKFVATHTLRSSLETITEAALNEVCVLDEILKLCSVYTLFTFLLKFFLVKLNMHDVSRKAPVTHKAASGGVAYVRV